MLACGYDTHRTECDDREFVSILPDDSGAGIGNASDDFPLMQCYEIELRDELRGVAQPV